MTVNRPVLRYFGGKFRLSDWVISHFPPHEVYVEPYGGAANILLGKEQAFLEVYNDLSQDVVNFFQVLRDRPNELIRAIELTPYSRVEKTLAYLSTDGPISLCAKTLRSQLARIWRFIVAAQYRVALSMEEKSRDECRG